MKKLEEILGAELYRQVTAALQGQGREGKDLELAIANDGSFVPKAKFDSLYQEKQALQEESKDLTLEVMALQALKKEKGELAAALQSVKEQQEADASHYEEEKAAMMKEHCLEKALIAAGARNPKAVKALLTTEEMTLVEGDLQGLPEQLATVKQEAPYLFNDERQAPEYQPQSGRSALDFKEMSDAEYYQFVNRKG